MAKESNIVHQYFKKKLEDTIILVKVNPIQYKGTEITLLVTGEIEMRDLTFDENILEDLKIDGFDAASALEFNLYVAGLAR